MKILCSLSGLEFSCDYFPGTFYSKETHHPIFNLPQKKLLSYTGKWAGGELTPTDSYLLFLAILHSSELIEFRVPVHRTQQTDAIIAQNMEFLVRTVIKLNTVTAPSVIFPRFVITPDTRFLTNVHYWIEAWEEKYQEFLSGVSRGIDDRKLVQREAALQRLIRNPHKPISSYSNQIADWAAIAGSFPVFNVSNPWTNDIVPLAEYWKQIITRAARQEYIYAIPKKDLIELLEHCEEHIPIGSIFSHALFKLLRHAVEKQNNFLGLGDLDISKSTYTILESSDSVEDANLKALIDSAPEEEPRQEQYPNKFQYMRAKLRWDMAKKYKKESGERRSDV